MCCKFSALPTSDVSMVIWSVACVVVLFGAPPIHVRHRLHFVMVDFFSRMARVPISQEIKPRALGVFKCQL